MNPKRSTRQIDASDQLQSLAILIQQLYPPPSPSSSNKLCELASLIMARGPSPLVPFLMVGVLSLAIFGPTLLENWEFLSAVQEMASSFVMVLPLMLLVLIHLLCKFFPSGRSWPAAAQQSGSGSDGDWYGLGALLFFLLFLVLYYMMS